jgi:hypothetical protein
VTSSLPVPVLPSTAEEALMVVGEEPRPRDTKMSRDGGDEYVFVGTWRRRLYLNEVVGRGPEPHRRGGAVVATTPPKQDVSRVQG